MRNKVSQWRAADTSAVAEEAEDEREEVIRSQPPKL